MIGATLTGRLPRHAGRGQVSGHLVYWRTQAKTVGGALPRSASRSTTATKSSSTAWSPRLATSSPVPGAHGQRRPRLLASPLRRSSTDHPSLDYREGAVGFTVREDGHSLGLRSTQPTWRSRSKRTASLSVPPTSLSRPRTPLVAGLTADVRPCRQDQRLLPEGNSVLYTPRKDLSSALSKPESALARRQSLPGRDELVSNGMDVQVVRVTTGDVVDAKTSPSTRFQGRSRPRLGRLRASTGVTASTPTEYEVPTRMARRSRVLVRDWVEQEPQDAVVYYSAESDYARPTCPRLRRS